VIARLGTPEYILKWRTQKLADYSEKGARFFFDATGKTIGVVYIPHGYPRVHEGARRLVDLSFLAAQPRGGSAASPDLSSWKAGAAVCKITPLEQKWLLREGWKVHDDLYARALYLTDGKTQISLVGADLFGMSYGVIREFIAAVRKQGGGELILAMAHNHAAPDTIGVYGHFPAEYVEYLGKQIVGVCAAAKQNARPVGSVRAASREMSLAGGRVHGWFRNARNPGILDPRIAVLRFDDTAGKTIAAVVNFACHVEGLEDGWMDMSADFPGYMCERMQQDLGGVCVFLNGALGGMVSGDGPSRTHDEARKFGLELAKELASLARAAPVTGSNVLKHVRCRLEIPTTNPRLLQFATTMETARKEQYLTRGRTVTEMQYLQIGTAQFCTIPGELLPEIAVEVLETMKGYPQMIVGLANDEIGYVIPAEDFRAGGSMTTMSGWDYEETMSLGPAAGPVIKEYARRIVQDHQTGF
jgi:hypothetical protein